MKARRLSSLALLSLAAIAFSSTAGAKAPYWCANPQKPPPGNPIDGRFMGLPYIILGNALAEKACGAKHKPMGPAILDAIQAQGCEPSTEIYREIADTVAKIEEADLRFIVSGGQPVSELTPSEVQRRADDMVHQLGGCARLLKNHDALEP